MDGLAAVESVDERVVGRDGGCGVNGGECVGFVEGGVVAAAALRCRRWRLRRERGVSVGGDGDHYGGDGDGGEGGGSEGRLAEQQHAEQRLPRRGSYV